MLGSVSRLRGYAPELAIAAASALYGSTFVLVQDALDVTTPSALNTMRFTVGAMVLLPFALRRGWRGPSARATDGARSMVHAALLLGTLAAVAYECQNVGLEYTSTSNSAFITGLFAVFAPIAAAIWYRRLPRRGIVGAVVLSMIGLFFLTGAEPTLGFGDAITLGTAVAFGIWFVVIGEVAPRFDILTLTAVQLATIAVISGTITVIEGWGTFDSTVWLAVVITGIGCSAIAFSLSAWAQRTIDPARASILNLLEPVVAGFVGYTVGERLGVEGYFGAFLILAGIVVAELGTHRASRRLARAAADPPPDGPNLTEA